MDTVLLVPPLDRGEGVRVVPVHQALLHDVIEGLKRGDRPVSSLFEDDRWNVVRSNIPWDSWQRELHRHDLTGSSEGGMDSRSAARLLMGQWEQSIDTLSWPVHVAPRAEARAWVGIGPADSVARWRALGRARARSGGGRLPQAGVSGLPNGVLVPSTSCPVRKLCVNLA